MSAPTDHPDRAFVLGLDGVPWPHLEAWIEADELPNFARLATEGAAGPLESTTPATTPLAWPSIATGTWPDKHGLYGFKKLSGDFRQEMYTSQDLRQPTLWDVLSPALVGNVPMTYPAGELDGKMVTGMTTPSLDERSTRPPELAERLEERIPDYRVGLRWSEYGDREDEFLEELHGLVAARRELMRELMRTDDWRLFFFVFTGPDRLQHLIWDEGTMLEFYRLLDEILGEVMEYARRHDAVLFVVSDHGFRSVSKNVYVNRILELAGYLSRRDPEGTRGVLARLGLSKGAVRSGLERAGDLEPTLERVLPARLVDAVANTVPGDHALFDVDHSETLAFSFGEGTMYVNDVERFENGVVDPSAVPALKRELRSLLESIVDPRTGEAVLEVSDGDSLFPTDDRAPDLVVEGRGEYMVSNSLDDRAIAPIEGSIEGKHDSEGIFLAWGPSIAPGTTPAGATVVDVAPTLLYCLDEPVGASMDGRVLMELVDPALGRDESSVDSETYLDAVAESGTPVEEDYDEVERRLRGLGYME